MLCVRSVGRLLVVLGHYPVYSVCSHGSTLALIELVLPMLNKYNVTGYLSGHDHCEEHIDDGTGVQHILTGDSIVNITTNISLIERAILVSMMMATAAQSRKAELRADDGVAVLLTDRGAERSEHSVRRRSLLQTGLSPHQTLACLSIRQRRQLLLRGKQHELDS